jgi:excisionase family DNA binding protein
METIFFALKPEELKQLISDAVSQALEGKLNTSHEEKTDILIKLDEVSKLLGVSKVTIHSWKRKGLIPFYRISNKIYFKEDEVMAALKKAKNSCQ